MNKTHSTSKKNPNKVLIKKQITKYDIYKKRLKTTSDGDCHRKIGSAHVIIQIYSSNDMFII